MDSRQTDNIASAFVRAATEPRLAGGLADPANPLGREQLDSEEADRELMQILSRYRTGHRAEEAPVLLAALAPVLVPRLSRLRPQAPMFARNDLRQELVVALLTAALTIPLSDDSRLVARRLMRRAGWGVTRRLRREQHQRALTVPLPSEDDDDDIEEA